MPLLVAWKRLGIWALFEARHLIKAKKNFNIRFEVAMTENQLGILAGDVAYKIAPGARVHLRLKKENLLASEETSEGLSEQWHMRVNKVGFMGTVQKPPQSYN